MRHARPWRIAGTGRDDLPRCGIALLLVLIRALWYNSRKAAIIC